jgi:hypothetical protein
MIQGEQAKLINVSTPVHRFRGLHWFFLILLVTFTFEGYIMGGEKRGFDLERS